MLRYDALEALFASGTKQRDARHLDVRGRAPLIVALPTTLLARKLVAQSGIVG